jgi:hypothetical protein
MEPCSSIRVRAERSQFRLLSGREMRGGVPVAQPKRPSNVAGRAAIQVKLNELIRVSAAQNSFVGIEHLTGEELEEIRTKCEIRAKAERAGEASVEKSVSKARQAADGAAG